MVGPSVALVTYCLLAHKAQPILHTAHTAAY